MKNILLAVVATCLLLVGSNSPVVFAAPSPTTAPPPGTPTGSFPIAKHYVAEAVAHDQVSPPAWAEYDTTVRVDGVPSNASKYDDTAVNHPIDWCMSFFSQDSALIYVNSNGFLTPMPTGACGVFCPAYTEFKWPMIGLYTKDMDPLRKFNDGSNIYVMKAKKTYDGVEVDVVIVEYYRVREYHGSNYNKTSEDNYFLTAQAELWQNGTIIYRYQSVPRESTATSFKPVVGLWWSDSMKKVVPAPQYKPQPNGVDVDIIAYRFESVDDTCQNKSTCDVCADTEGCVWCSNINRCMSKLIGNNFCRGADVHDNSTTCQLGVGNGYDDEYATIQRFYTTAVHKEVPYVDLRQLSPNTTSLYSDPNTTVLGHSAYPQFDIKLHFSFPLFYNPKEFVPGDEGLLSEVHLDHKFFLSRTSDQACERSTSENAYYRFCPKGDYADIIAPFLINTAVIRPQTELHILRLDERDVGDILCTEAAVDHETGRCPPAAAFQVTNLFTNYTQYLVNGRPAIVFATYQLFDMMMIIDATGAVTMHYDSAFNKTVANELQFFQHINDDPILGNTDDHCTANSMTSPFYATPAPYIGIVNKKGVLDSTSAMVPPLLVGSGKNVQIRFSPTLGCRNCNNNGICNMRTRECECVGNYIGAECNECKPGTYGYNCANCTHCQNGGSCDDGRNGTGVCKCSDPYSGKYCEKTCTGNEPGVTYQCASCYHQGGYCDCGVCKCDTEKGWHGAECYNWTDPCEALSLDGCKVCVTANLGIKCSFCSYTCIGNTDDPSVPSDRVRSCPVPTRQITEISKSRCPTWNRPPAEDGSLTVIAIVVLFTAMGLCTCVTVLVVCVFRRRPPNPLVVAAVIGTPDFEMPRREREVIQMQMVQRPKNGHPVQGVPLKQIPLKELYALQQQRRLQGSFGHRSTPPVHTSHVVVEGL